MPLLCVDAGDASCSAQLRSRPTWGCAIGIVKGSGAAATGSAAPRLNNHALPTVQSDVRQTAEQQLRALLDGAKASSGAVFSLDALQLEVHALVDVPGLTADHMGLDEIPQDIGSACISTWRTDPTAIVMTELADQHLAVVPLPSAGRVCHWAALFSSTSSLVGSPELVTAARLAGSALAAAVALEQQQRESVVVDLLGRWAQSRATPDTALRDLAAATPAVTGSVLVDVVVATRRLASASGLRPATGELHAVLARWRRMTVVPPAAFLAGHLVVPLVAGKVILGAMVLDREPPHDCDRVRLSQLAAGFSATIASAIDGQALARSKPLLDAVADRARLADRCFRELDLVMDAVSRELRQAGPAEGRLLVAQRLLLDGRALLRDATDVLTEPDSARTSLLGELRQVSNRMETRGGPPVRLASFGRTPPIEADCRIALLRAYRDALLLFRVVGARWLLVGVEGDHDMTLTLRPEALQDLQLGRGINLGNEALTTALRRIRIWLAPVSGRAHYAIHHGQPLLTLTVPLARPRSPAASGSAGSAKDGTVVHVLPTADIAQG